VEGVNRWRTARWTVIAALLLLPLIVMQFAPEMDWDAADFALAAVLLVGAGATYEIATRNSSDPRRRRTIAVGLIAVVLIIWAEAAVGIFR
jgi:uncharacterized membrane protein